MGVYRKEAEKVLELVGGKENVVSASHCVTRLRLVLKDQSKAKPKEIEKLDSVKGTFTNAGQFQVVIGNKVGEFFNDFIEAGNIKSVSKEESKKAAQENMNIMQRIIGGLAEIFIPLLPAIITGGLILGFRNIIGDLAIFGDGTQTLIQLHPVLGEVHSFLWVIGEAIFHFLPVGVTWSTVKKFGGSEILGIVLGICLVSPQLLNAYGYAEAAAKGAIPFWDFGIITVDKVGYQAQVIPAILAGITLSKIEITIKKYIPDVLKMIIVPFVAIIVTVLLSYIIIGPVSREIGNGLAAVFTYLLTGPFKIIGAIVFGLVYAPLVITGLHHTFIAVDLQLIANNGGTMIWPLIALSNIAQGSAAMAMVILYKRDSKIKSIALSSGISAWLGVTEPAMFGVNLKFKYPFYAAIIGSASAAVVSIMTGVLANSIGVGGLPAFLAIQPSHWLTYMLAMGVAVAVPFILTFVFYKRDQIKNNR
ncbi:PTS system trehalose-specific EIIBC component [Clostridium sardiniense]|uniref:PTS system trehalose-specific EIIBC component n=1 Tax=Clostridium sardiniense TaxID=29369 RepID=A0ABS7L366_CLOSR|nr:PTS system trehalose-specific EIIBC component [Clostridium sardiniense]MBY0757323.1 PTS system trehalose-specific EIIBC component [Clostridium sardiniense]MDQ0461735.1 PTS system trehalose-specific IIC component [Clostridium sardiniense]